MKTVLLILLVMGASIIPTAFAGPTFTLVCIAIIAAINAFIWKRFDKWIIVATIIPFIGALLQ